MTTMAVSDRAPAKPDRSDFLPIGVDTITASTELTFNLYMRVDPASPPILYRECQLALEPSDFNRLSDQGTTTLYIRVADHTAYRALFQSYHSHHDSRVAGSEHRGKLA